MNIRRRTVGPALAAVSLALVVTVLAGCGSPADGEFPAGSGQGTSGQPNADPAATRSAVPAGSTASEPSTVPSSWITAPATGTAPAWEATPPGAMPGAKSGGAAQPGTAPGTYPAPQPSIAPASGQIPLGVFTPAEASSWAAVAAFGQQAGQAVRYVVAYLGPSNPFPQQLGQETESNGAEMVLQLEPTMSMAQVAAGDYDGYLDSLAAAVCDYDYPVILSWAPEANGNWYQWGAPQTPIADYRAAWAYVMSQFRQCRNVTWMDTINRTYAGAAPTSEYVIPGVGMYGLDAYYEFANDTFNSVVGTTLAQIRAVTNKPVMISETGIGPAAGQARSLPGLIQGARADQLVGLIYFDVNQGNTSLIHQDWALTSASMQLLRDSLAG
jgi:mannan endo-1,4-beta-mannosidase